MKNAGILRILSRILYAIACIMFLCSIFDIGPHDYKGFELSQWIIFLLATLLEIAYSRQKNE